MTGYEGEEGWEVVSEAWEPVDWGQHWRDFRRAVLWAGVVVVIILACAWIGGVR